MQWHQLDYTQSTPRSRQITTPTPHHSIFTGWVLFLTPNQRRQITEGNGFLQQTVCFMLTDFVQYQSSFLRMFILFSHQLLCHGQCVKFLGCPFVRSHGYSSDVACSYQHCSSFLTLAYY